MNSQIQASSRVILITGANKGIGYCIAKGLLAQKDQKDNIILTSRNEDLGRKAVQELIANPSAKKECLQYHQLDVNDQKSRETLRDWIKEKYGKLDVLINNAGYARGLDFWDSKCVLDEGYNNQMECINTNFINVRALTEELHPLLSEDGKIINISSELGSLSWQGDAAVKALSKSDLQEKDLDDLLSQYEKASKENRLKKSGLTEHAYCFTKVMLNYWTRCVLPMKLKGDQQAFTVAPGWCRTDMGGSGAPKTPDDGADTPIYLINLSYKRDDKLCFKFIESRKVREW